MAAQDVEGNGAAVAAVFFPRFGNGPFLAGKVQIKDRFVFHVGPPLFLSQTGFFRVGCGNLG